MFNANCDIFSRFEWTKDLHIAKLSMQHNVTLLGNVMVTYQERAQSLVVKALCLMS